MNSHKKHTILIVDDESHILDMYGQVLAMVGYNVVVASDGKEAVEKLRSLTGQQLSLILLDIIMPKMDGFDFLEKIKKDNEFKKVPVIMLTNLNKQEDIDEAKRLGAIDFVVKVNIMPSQLVSKVNKVLDRNEE